MADKPLCFILMPFGKKPDPSGKPEIDFDRVYNSAIEPAVRAAGMEPIRADREKTGGIIHKPMFERLLLCEYAVADLTTANPNVFYELGVRHAARPRTTQAIFATHQPIPFDVNFLRALPYDLGDENSFGESEAARLRRALRDRLEELRRLNIEQAPVDSPIFQLLEDWKPPDPSRLKTDVFHKRVKVDAQRKAQMSEAVSKGPKEGLAELKKLQDSMAFDLEEAGVLVDLMLSYRDLKGWDEMIELYEAMPQELKRQVMVREQLAFALNRRGGPADRKRAIEILEEVIDEQGPTSETCGLLGRIHKDLWDQARGDSEMAARGHLNNAIKAYSRGFEADWRDAFPGINALTLLEVRGDEESLKRQERMLPVVRYAVEQRMRGDKPDYWDHATMLELSVLGSDHDAAAEHLANALAAVRASWEPETTARNLSLIQGARRKRGEDAQWIGEAIEALKKEQKRLEG